MQQINLYQDEFKNISPPYSANTMVLLTLLSVVIGVVISAILATLMWWWEGELEENRTQWSVWQSNLQRAKIEFPEPKVDARLARNISGFKLDIERNRQVLKYLHSQQLNSEHQSFSVILLALTWVSEKDLWLTNIKISKGGASLSLEGRALNAGALPNYLKKLSDIEVFSDMKLRVFEMTRAENGLTFLVSSDRVVEEELEIREQINVFDLIKKIK